MNGIIKTFFCLALVASILLYPCLLFSDIRPGDRAPFLNISSWLKNGPVKIEQPAGVKSELIYVLEFWATRSETSVRMIPHLNYLEKKFSPMGVRIIAVSRDEKEALRDFLKKHRINYSVGVDYKGATTETYLGIDSVPVVFLIRGKDRAVLWRGDVVDLERVLEKYLSGEFDIEDQKKISALKKDLRLAAQSGDIKLAEKISDEILDVDPREASAIKWRLLMYEARNQNKKALKFVNERIEKDSNNKDLYFLKLKFMTLNHEKTARLKKVVRQIIKRFSANPSVMNSLSEFLLCNMPFPHSFPREALSAALTAVDSLNGKSSRLTHARYYSTLARAYYNTGATEKAVEYQHKAGGYLKESPKKLKNSEQILEFYEATMALRKSLLRNKTQ